MIRLTLINDNIPELNQFMEKYYYKILHKMNDKNMKKYFIQYQNSLIQRSDGPIDKIIFFDVTTMGLNPNIDDYDYISFYNNFLKQILFYIENHHIGFTKSTLSNEPYFFLIPNSIENNYLQCLSNIVSDGNYTIELNKHQIIFTKQNMNENVVKINVKINTNDESKNESKNNNFEINKIVKYLFGMAVIGSLLMVWYRRII